MSPRLPHLAVTAFALCAPMAYVGCASSGITVISDTPRVRNVDIRAESGGPAVRFVNKGAYITGITSSSNIKEGDWISMSPKIKPSDPFMLARVAGLQKNRSGVSGRLEILAYRPELRESFNLKKIDSLQPVTKRLLKASSRPSPNSAIVPAGDMTGTEIYCAITPGRDPERRISSQCRSIMVPAPKTSSDSNVTELISPPGYMAPPDAVFLLMDAPPPPSYKVRIHVHGPERARIAAAASRLTTSSLPGMEFISVVRPDTTDKDAPEVISSIGKRQTDTLEVHLVYDAGRYSISDQTQRVMDAQLAALRPIFTDNPTEELLATSLVMQALDTAGFAATAAFLGERHIYSNPESLVPLSMTLARAYHNMERDDWAVEIALELADLSRQNANVDNIGPILTDTSDNTRLSAGAAAAAIAAMTDTSAEMTDVFKTTYTGIKKHVDSAQFDDWKQIFAFAVKTSAGLPENSEADMWASQILSNGSDPILSCIADLESCDCSPQKAPSKYEQAVCRAYLAAGSGDLPEMLNISLKLDDLGAPWPAALIWSEIASASNNAPTAWLNAAAYMRRAQRQRHYLHTMSAIASKIYGDGGELASIGMYHFNHAVSGWIALDMRPQMASFLAYQAASKKDKTLLKHAIDLYRSMYDVEHEESLVRMMSPER